MTDEELIARLRKYKDDLLSITADRIKALVKERDAAEQRGYANAMEAERKLHEDRAERLEAALQKLACKCPSNCDWERDDICPSWIARAALQGDDHE